MFLYIDPGTGSMLFTILIGVLSAAIYAFRDVLVKLKFVLSGGNVKRSDDAPIPFVFSQTVNDTGVFSSRCVMKWRGAASRFYT